MIDQAKLDRAKEVLRDHPPEDREDLIKKWRAEREAIFNVLMTIPPTYYRIGDERYTFEEWLNLPNGAELHEGKTQVEAYEMVVDRIIARAEAGLPLSIADDELRELQLRALETEVGH